ncbi:hypothetical protein E2I00_007738 [Balaenoptera physalus]|uniref:Uncharacterized protein n=1 Tax=Balaenoptera physalus TaxID=9770 RepID=A0A6A1Q427_BALPH|nr:hypothetical protein E2I00_007738 [Balaenoptera physalus]
MRLAAETEDAGRKHPSTGSDNKSSPHPKQPCRPPRTPGPCWFCPASPEVESIWWSTLARIATLPWPKEAYLTTVSSFCPLDTTIQWRSFARGGGRDDKRHHLQNQVILVPSARTPLMTLEMPSFPGHRDNRQCFWTSQHSAVKQMAQPGAAAYFYVVFDSGEKPFHRIKRNFPLQFGREVMASKAILNIPDKSD